jgi:hypothetical protein
MKRLPFLAASLVATAVLLGSCQTPPATPYDRPLNAMKFSSGGVNPSHHHDKKK